MDNKWNDIVLTLLKLKEASVDEATYQESIEEQFKFLGWSISKGCVESKPVLPEGNAKSLIPEIADKYNIPKLPNNVILSAGLILR